MKRAIGTALVAFALTFALLRAASFRHHSHPRPTAKPAAQLDWIVYGDPRPAIPTGRPRLGNHLDKVIDHFVVRDCPLADAFSALGHQTGDCILFHPDAPTGLGPAAPRRVNLDIRSTPARKVLLSLLSAGLDRESWGEIHFPEGVVLISGGWGYYQPVEIRVTDMRDLTVPLTKENLMYEPRASYCLLANPRLPANAQESEQQVAANLVELFRDTVDPISWRVNGGLYGSLAYWDGRLIVTQTAENHRKLAEVLGQLREQKFQPSQLPSSPPKGPTP